MAKVATSPTLLVHSPFASGGGETQHVVTLSCALSSLGVSVSAVVHEGVARNHIHGAALQNAGVEVIPLPDLYHLPAAIRIPIFRWTVLRRLGRRRFTSVLCNGTGGSHLWFRTFVAPQGRYVWHDHTDGAYHGSMDDSAFAPPESFSYPSKILRVAQAADLIIIGSPTGQDNLRNVQHLTQRIVVLPPMVQLQPPLIVEGECSGGTLRVSCFSRLENGKGISGLLRVWKSLALPDVELHFHGSGDKSTYERNAAALGLGNVYFHGPYDRTSLSLLMRQTDLGIFPSISEGYGLIALEYMAHGVPFVMTGVGAAPQLAANSPDILVAAIAESAVAQALREMVHRVRTGQTSRTRLVNRFKELFHPDKLARSFYRTLFPTSAEEVP